MPKPKRSVDPDTVQINIRVPRALHAKLLERATQARRSQANYLRVLLEDTFEQQTNSAAKQGVAVHE